jgi:hypothetical protein
MLIKSDADLLDQALGYIYYYNNLREHSALSYKTPFSYLKAHLLNIDDKIRFVIPVILDRVAVELGPWSGYHVLAQHQEGKEIYRQRKKIAEPVFGQIKFNLGFRRFRLRGSDKAGGEWTLVCLVHNIRKIYARIMAKGGELHSLTRELQVVYNPT